MCVAGLLRVGFGGRGWGWIVVGGAGLLGKTVLWMEGLNGLPLRQHLAPPLPHPLQGGDQKVGQHPTALLREVQPVCEVLAPLVPILGTQLTQRVMEVHQLQTEGLSHHTNPASILPCDLVLSVQVPSLLAAVEGQVLHTAIMQDGSGGKETEPTCYIQWKS